MSGVEGGLLRFSQGSAFDPLRTVRASAWGWRVEVRLLRDTAVWVLTPLMAPLMAVVSDSDLRQAIPIPQ
jgi:hypothetical protein